MRNMTGRLESLYLGGSEDDMSKAGCSSLEARLSGFEGDRHGDFEREAWAGDDKQPEGTLRRNERQWSAVSVEELAEISRLMDLTRPLDAGVLGANLCFSSIANLSHLPKGSILRFPSGAELLVEEYNPPCVDMGEKIASDYSTHSGRILTSGDFLSSAKYSRGLVGVVEVPGTICAGDVVQVFPYKSPPWLGKY